MIKIFLFLFILTTGNLFSQKVRVHEFPMEENAILWKITGDNVTESCYLFGTMHLIEKNYFLFPRKLKKIVKKSEVLMMELAGMPDQAEAMGYILLKEGSFFDFFTEEQTDTILQWANDKLGIEEPMFRAGFSQMKPFAVMQLGIQLHFTGKTESYELTFDAMAKENKIEVKGLETVAQQMSFFDDLSNEQQAEMLMQSIRDGDKGVNTIQEMQELYQEQNIDKLYQYITESESIIKEEQQKFLDNRNRNWIPQIIEQVAKISTFIAVGAGHLGGPNGVIRLLEKEGYILTPIQL
ncbi:MAG TPA: TraB/GumN family protein [Crocinitomicaceae bacterium]|nr:TraB/GumN family protein [Crocinitomicaceae bacterium]